MRGFVLTMAAAGLALGAAAPAFAQDTMIDAETLTCAQFTAMEPDDQAKAVAALQEAATGTATTTSEVKGNAMTGSDSDVTALNTACAGNDAKLAKELMGGM